MTGSRGKITGLRRLISFEDAASRVMGISWRKPHVIEVEIEQALDMVCAETVVSEVFVPPFDRSAVDGFAIIHEDTVGASESAPAQLNLIEGSQNAALPRGKCIRISTGQKLPESSDSVVMKEYTTLSGATVHIEKSLRAWENVSRRGEDITRGSKVVTKGETVKSWHIAALSAVGRERVLVFSRIKLGVISTGNEIMPGSKSGIRNSTQPLMLAYFRRGYVETSDEGVYPDEYDCIMDAVKSASERCDVLVITGGSSVGEADLSSSVLKDLGDEIFRGIMIQPGRTISLYRIEGIPAYLVSGLPVAALTSFDALFQRYLLDVLGFKGDSKTILARLTGRIISKIGIRSYVRVALSRKGDSLDATPMRNAGSGMLSSLLKSNGLATIPENSEGMDEGEYIWVTLTGGPV